MERLKRIISKSVLLMFLITLFGLPQYSLSVFASGEETIRINFQPEGVDIPDGYLPDYGDVYDSRNDLTYGWNVDHSNLTRDRNDNDDQALDTLCHFHEGGIWEIALEDGTYIVKVSIGDAGFSKNHTINVEGVNYWDNIALDANQFENEEKVIEVLDGKLTVDQGSLSEKSTRINYVEITQESLLPPTKPKLVKINFQPEDSLVPVGYIPDCGEVYGDRNDYTYGWNVDHSNLTRDRNLNDDQELDTLCHFHEGGIWEIALEDGTYIVKVSIGDAGFSKNHTINVEGVNYWDNIALDANQFENEEKVIKVSDGKLTVDQGNLSEKSTRINYIEILNVLPDYSIEINFQPDFSPLVEGYIPDYGFEYGEREGYTYGWNVDHTDLSRDRNRKYDQRIDTFCGFKENGIWEIALEDGNYQVEISYGDAVFSGLYTINVEGENLCDNESLPGDEFKTNSICVDVLDGKLTIDNGDLGENLTKINYVRIREMPAKFLVVINSRLLEDQDLENEFNKYIVNTTIDGWDVCVLKVNNEPYPGTDAVCPDPDSLKAEIRNYYNDGCEGFVIIGSPPFVPIAEWTPYLEWENHNGKDEEYEHGYWSGVTDFFYADMYSNWPKNDQGHYYSIGVNDEPVNGLYSADMFWGRISAECIVDENVPEKDEAYYITKYLQKVNLYKTEGYWLESEKQDDALIFLDDDWRLHTGDIEAFSQMFKNIKEIYDDPVTTPGRLLSELENGYLYVSATYHAGTVTPEQYMAINPKVHFMNLSSCGQADVRTKNSGATILFDSDYCLNLTGSMISTGHWMTKEIYDLFNQEGIGPAFKKKMNDTLEIKFSQGEANVRELCITLLGDPTIKHGACSKEDTTPVISREEERIIIMPLEEYTLQLQSVDPDVGDVVTIEVPVKPEGAVFNSNTNTLIWTPEESDMGLHILTATAQDTQGNKYESVISIEVKRPYDLKFEEGEDAIYWDYHNNTGYDSDFYVDNLQPRTGENSARIVSDEYNDAWLSCEKSIKQNTDYVLRGYIKTENVESENGGAGANLTVYLEGPSYATTGQIYGTSDWQYVEVYFNSGSRLELVVFCRLGSFGNRAKGTAYFDDLELIEVTE